MIKVKIDTKEHFRVFQVKNTHLYANLAEPLLDLLQQYLDQPPGNVIIDMKEVENVEKPVVEVLSRMQSICKDKHISFVIAKFPKQHEESHGLNCVPTLREAIDMVMMENLEREFLNEEKNQ